MAENGTLTDVDSAGTPCACKCYAKPLQMGVPELFPDSFPVNS